ncbi:MAG TPA: 50S ribosomal protein L25 [Tepidisphaeraceae bacterium]|jgi:large subunit ribosomal protein L25|nr:50S ribosomal protein L25 [Tepidisphaeraceae bacterium]
MANTVEVNAKSRKELGSRANKRLRESGLLPGVIYGHRQAVLPVTLTRKEVANHLQHGAHLFSLALDGQKETVLVKEVQYDHLGIELIHIDFSRVDLNERVKITVPLELKGTPKGEADGGVLQQLIADLEIECVVTDIPDMIRYNVSDLGLNAILHVKDLILPPNVKTLQDGDFIVATVKEIVETAVAAEGETAEPEVIGRKPEEAVEEPAKK